MNKTWQIALLGLFSFIALLASPFAIADMHNTHEFVLPNKLKLIVKEDHRAPVVINQVWYKVGSSYEPNGITGISHLLEHMMFDGTTKHPAGEFDRIIAENGGKQNATTTTDYTMYYEELAADKLPIAFELEADRMQNLALTQQQFNKEIKVVREERRLRTDDNPQAMTYERLSASAFISNPYHHPVVGWMSDLKHMTLADVRSWYNKWYAPNNAILVVVGDVDPQKVLALAQQYFGNIPMKTLPTVKPHGSQRPLGVRTVNVNMPAKLPWLVFAFNVPVVKTARTPWEPYALEVLDGILTVGDSGRLQKNIVRGQQIVSAASSGYDPFTLYSNLFYIAAVPTPNHTIKATTAALLQQIQQLQQQPISQAELQKIINQVVASKVFGKDSLANQAFELGSLEAIGLPWQLADQYVERIKQVTPQQVQAVANKYLVKKRLTIATLKPLPIKQQEKPHAHDQSQ